MNNKDFVVNTLKQIGFKIAQELQSNIPDMEATDIIEQEEYLPRFDNTKQYLNFNAGYTCFSAKGNVVRLLQPYDSLTYPQEPEELPAQWRFVWSTDPGKALPFLSLSTSPYAKGDCCTAGGKTWRSKIDTNTWSPETNPEFWEEVEP